jgi:hypothetical protein
MLFLHPMLLAPEVLSRAEDGDDTVAAQWVAELRRLLRAPHHVEFKTESGMSYTATVSLHGEAVVRATTHFMMQWHRLVANLNPGQKLTDAYATVEVGGAAHWVHPISYDAQYRQIMLGYTRVEQP